MRTSLKKLLLAVLVVGPLLACTALTGCGDDNGPEDLYFKLDLSVLPVFDLTTHSIDSASPHDAG